MKKFLTIIIIIILFLTAGCMDYHEILTINPNGSGIVEKYYDLDKKFIDQMMAMYNEMAQANPDNEKIDFPTVPEEMMPDSVKTEEILLQAKTNIKLIHYEKNISDSLHHWIMKFSFKDTNELSILNNILSTYLEPPGENSKEIKPVDILFKRPDGILIYYRKLDNSKGNDVEKLLKKNGFFEISEFGKIKDKNSQPYELSDEIADLVEVLIHSDITEEDSLLSDDNKKSLVFDVFFPGEIIETNATEFNGNKAKWEYRLLDMNDPNLAQIAIIKL
jgi:hypothetical protein